MSKIIPISRGRAVFLSLALILLLAASYMQVKAGNAGDKNWLLLAARMWLGGKKLYIDIFEVNPPLIVWLYAIPVRASLYISWLEDYQIMALIWLVVCVLTAMLCVRLIRFHPGFKDDKSKQTDFMLLVASLFIFFSQPVYFADREHILLVLTFPYMLRFMPALARTPMPWRLELLVGILAVIGFCIKPYTVIIFAAIQLLYILRERSFGILFATENCIIYAGGALYIFCVWFFMPEYMSVVVPMAWLTYHGYSLKENGFFYCALAFISLGVTFVDFRPRYRTPYRRDVYYFLAVSAALLVYALANNGWGYTYNPLLSLIIFISGWMLWDFSWLKRDAELCGLPSKQFIFGQRSCATNIAANTIYIAFCITLWLVPSFTRLMCETFTECDSREPYRNYIERNHIHSFAAFSMNFHIWSEVVRQTGARWDTRFNHMWMLPSLLKDSSSPEFIRKSRWIVEYVGRSYAEDLNRWKPEIAFVDTSEKLAPYYPHRVDIPAYFSQIPEFKAAWAHYRYETTIDSCAPKAKSSEPPDKKNKNASTMDCRYTIYKRIPENPGEK